MRGDPAKISSLSDLYTQLATVKSQIASLEQQVATEVEWKLYKYFDRYTLLLNEDDGRAYIIGEIISPVFKNANNVTSFINSTFVPTGLNGPDDNQLKRIIIQEVNGVQLNVLTTSKGKYIAATGAKYASLSETGTYLYIPDIDTFSSSISGVSQLTVGNLTLTYNPHDSLITITDDGTTITLSMGLAVYTLSIPENIKTFESMKV